MAHESRSYYDDYIRSKAVLKHCGDENAKTLLTDRNAYISFLEVQLERVSAACLTTQTFERRLAELESVQTTNDQKLGSLSKVFRLNQEYVEHTSTQAQTELAAHAAKVDAWMEKFSAELERQQPRMATLEEQFQHCQDFLPRLTEANDAALHDMKRQTEHEIEEMKALIYALETRIEEIQTCQTSTDRKLNNLTDTATHKLDRELTLVRSSVSEKSFQLERTVAQLGNDLDQLVHQMDASWRAEVSESTKRYDTNFAQLEQRLHQLQLDLTQGQSDVKGVLKKCLDTQHLLSGTLVALQSEVDDAKQTNASVATKDLEAVTSAIRDLQAKQNTLRNALQLMQACALEAQEAGEEHCTKLADRLDAIADSVENRTDDLRKRMLAALEDIGDKLQLDAGATTENTLQAAHAASESHFSHVMEFTTTLENRLRILEYTVWSLKTKVQRSRAISEVLEQTNLVSPAKARTPNLPDKFAPRSSVGPFGKNSPSGLDEQIASWNNEQYYLEHIRELEERLDRKVQSEQEHRALFTERTRIYSKASSKASSKSSASPPSCISSLITDQESSEERFSRRTRVTPKVIKRSAKSTQPAGASQTTRPKKLQTITRNRLENRGRLR